ncbi:hypothetical protein C8F01DRAFT_1295137 [Mycena amicta]|nr:hypothetical protein C8F01DRAFT_1295137 [Mycena amicta]
MWLYVYIASFAPSSIVPPASMANCQPPSIARSLMKKKEKNDNEKQLCPRLASNEKALPAHGTIRRTATDGKGRPLGRRARIVRWEVERELLPIITVRRVVGRRARIVELSARWNEMCAEEGRRARIVGWEAETRHYIIEREWTDMSAWDGA